MTIFTENQAKEHFDEVLKEATTLGEVKIRRGDGQEFLLKPLPMPSSEIALSTGRQRDLSDLAGTWVDDPAFDQAIRDQDQVDPDLWK
jgi:hypothetical protein